MRIKTIVIYILMLCFCFDMVADSIVQNERLKIELWAEIDIYPGVKEEDGYIKNRFLSLSHFILEGMVYGWDFEYTPSDKTRNVTEFFSLDAVVPYSTTSYNKSVWKDPWQRDNLICYWLEYERTPLQIDYYNNRTSISYKKISGVGKASLENGFEGIKDSVKDCARSAVREYARAIVKNKPQEVSGRLLLSGSPRIYAKSGQYVTDLDFFVEINKIIEYNQF